MIWNCQRVTTSLGSLWYHRWPCGCRSPRFGLSFFFFFGYREQAPARRRSGIEAKPLLNQSTSLLASTSFSTYSLNESPVQKPLPSHTLSNAIKYHRGAGGSIVGIQSYTRRCRGYRTVKQLGNNDICLALSLPSTSLGSLQVVILLR